MKKGICWDCEELKLLTKHSKNGGHKPPFIYLCWDCHKKRHGIRNKKYKINKKYKKGTKRVHKKKWK